ncbi:hypothetical protein BGZ82_001204, partial [Podila clonocystis]
MSRVDSGSSSQDSRQFLNRKTKLGDCQSQARSLSPAAVLPNYKTEFCNKFQEAGYCPFGGRCQFVHEFHELQKRGRALTYKTRVCRSEDNCRYQQNHGRCIYLHDDETAEMFDQQRGISYAQVQKIPMNKKLRQQYKGRNKKQQGQGRQRHHSTESSGTEFSSRLTSIETSSDASPLTHPVNRLSTLSNTSSGHPPGAATSLSSASHHRPSRIWHLTVISMIFSILWNPRPNPSLIFRRFKALRFCPPDLSETASPSMV